jgi:hypothetical protein
MHISRTFLLAAGATALTLGLAGCGATEEGIINTAAISSPSADASASASAAAEARASAAAEEALASAEASAKAKAKAKQVAEDTKTIDKYLGVVEDVQTALEDAKEAATNSDVAALNALGSRFVRISFAGDALDDIPRAGRTANKAWDSAMTNMRVAGGGLQTGMYEMAADAMADVIKDIGTSADALPDTL